jgi:hypothetical protein
MTKKTEVISALGAWFVILITAILNGAFREAVITPGTGPAAAHIISTVILICMICVITYLYVKMIRVQGPTINLFTIGLVWMLMTVAFEFIFGHYVMGHPFEKLIEDYNIFKGRMWILVLLTLLFAPSIIRMLISNGTHYIESSTTKTPMERGKRRSET